MNDSTIAALATSPGPGALGVIRISGKDSLKICDDVFVGKRIPSRAGDRSAILGEIVAADGSPVDQVVLLVMRGPRSYTGEDVVEISCHGGDVAPRLVLRRLIEAGAEPAAAGDFTKRAFLNGKMDLTQAEAVADIVRANGERALKAAVRQLKGGLSRKLDDLEAGLLEILAGMEAAIDFPEEEDVPAPEPTRLADRLTGLLGRLEGLLAAYERGRYLRQGLDVAIVGKPNVGKSSIFNLLIGEDRVITSEEPGTTRDVVDGIVELAGVRTRLHDTAGVMVPVGAVEEQAVARTRRVMADADVALVVLDSSKPLSKQDREILDSVKGKPHVILANKTDLQPQADLDGLKGAVRISALKGWGLTALRNALEAIGSDSLADLDSEVFISERHAACIRKAREHLMRALGAVGGGLSPEFAAADLRQVLECVGEVTGRQIGEGILDEIFSRFCIGK